MDGQKEETVPLKMRPTYEAIVNMTNVFCTQHLNEEYAEVARRLAAALARKRPSPLAQGQVRTWACGIVYTVGSENFLFDKSQTPHLRADELCALFGVGKSTGSAKATAI